MSTLARFIRENGDEILRRWQSAVHRPVLGEQARALLERIAAVARGERVDDGLPVLEAGEPGAALMRMVSELVELRSAVWTAWAHAGRRLEPEAVAAFDRAFDALLVRAAGERLELEQSRLRAVTENSPALIFLKDLDGRYLSINRRALEPLGLTPDVFLGRTDREIFPAEVAEILESTDRSALETQRAVTTEENVRRDGDVRTFLTTKFPISDPRGQQVALGGIATDITHRKRQRQAERFLARASKVLSSSLEYETTLSKLADLIVPQLADCCIIDMATDEGELRRLRVSHADPAKAALAEQLQGIPTENSPHLLLEAFETRRAVLVSEASDTFAERVTDTPEHAELLRMLAPKSVMQVPMMARNRLLGAIAFVICESNRRYGRHDLALADELASRAALAVDHARLYRVAQDAIHARERILAIVAHDLRAPLNAVAISLDFLLKSGPAEAAQRRALETAERSIQRMNRQIEDLMDIASIDAGVLSVSMRTLRVSELLREAVELKRGQATDVGIELRVWASESLRISGDRDRLLQVFENLIGNAIKFCRPGGRVTLGADADGQHVRCWVRDDGPGIPGAHRERIFEPFWQAKPADRRGAGLGLPICRGIVQAHGGRIWAESTPGEGTRICFTLRTAASSTPSPGG